MSIKGERMNFEERIAKEISMEIESRIKKCLNMIRIQKKEGAETSAEVRGWNKAVDYQYGQIQKFMEYTQTQHTAGNFHVTVKE